MAIIVQVNGVNYSIPQEGETGWGSNVTSWIQSVSTNVLQKTGGTFTLSAEVDFGNAAGLKTLYYKSRAASPASSGVVRLGNNESVSWRNSQNNADLGLKVNASDILEFQGAGLAVGGEPVQTQITVSDTSTIDMTLAANDVSAAVVAGSLLNSHISGSAQIAYSKLALASSIVNADISGSAQIAYSKLSLTGAIVNADISASAAIAHSKIAAVTASRALVSDGSGIVSASAVTSTELSLLSGKTGTLATLTGAEILTNKTLTSPAITAPRIDVVTLDGQASSPSNPSAGDYKLFVSDTTQKLTLRDSTGAETTVGASSGGGINYLSANPDFEVGTTGYVVSKNSIAAASPDSGFVTGSTNITLTRVASTALAGTAYGLITKGAANRQGEQIYVPFSIDNAYKGQQLSINMLFNVISGTYASGDLTAWIYDVTNNVFIQPSAFSLQSTGIAGPIQPMVFQSASNSTSYRLVLHVASTSALAYTVAIDNLSVGPQIVPVGAAMTDTVSFTPAISNVPGTQSATWRRVGNEILVQGKVAVTGAVTGTLNFFQALPSGLALDTAKMLSGSVYGTAFGFGATAQNANIYYSSGLGAGIGYTDDDGSQWSAAFPFTWANGNELAYQFKVPIVGWSSNTVVSDSAASRVVSLNTGGVVPTNSMTAGSFQTITMTAMSSVGNDTHGCFTPTTGQYVVKVPGTYAWQANLEITRTSGAVTNASSIRIFNSTRGVASGGTPSIWITAGGELIGIGGAGQIEASAGDVLVFQTYHSGGTGYAWSNAINASILSLNLIQGPAQIQAATRITARYTNSATAISGTPTTVVWTNKVSDTVGGMVSGEYTCQAPGDYDVTTALLLGGTFALNTQIAIEIQKNGVRWSAKQDYAGGAVTRFNASIDDCVTDCVTGDKIRIQIASGATTPTIVSSADHNYVTIRRTSGVN